jgi:hypothetical protein
MNHQLSIETKAADRYLLGDLLPTERDAFEEHFFECPECAGEVRAGSVLAHGARAFFGDILREKAMPMRPTPARSWRSWFVLPTSIPAAAAFALLTFTVYQNAMLLPGLRRMAAVSAQPQVLPSAVLVPASRSTLPSVSVQSAAPFFELSLALPPTMSPGKYDCELRDDTGRSRWNMQVSVDSGAEDVNLLVPAGRLAAGSYEIVMHGSGQRDTDPFRFKLIRQ